VVVGAEQDPITETLSTVAALLALGLPIIVVVAGAATYTLVGRSLRPVERMRSRVGEITTADLSERLLIPRARDEITALAVTLNAMLARIEAGHAAQRRFVGDASHELRSPLATVTAALELGSERPEILDRALLTETLLPEAQRMQHLVDDLLLLAKADERGLALRVVDVDLDDILHAEVGRIRLTSGHTVVAEITPTRVRGDAVALARVIRNLTDNAVRHARSRVVLSCAWAAGTATVTVADDGPASRWTSASGCCSASSAWTPAGHVLAVVPVWGSRSWPRSSLRTAAGSRSASRPGAGRRSWYACRWMGRVSRRRWRSGSRPRGSSRSTGC